VLDISVIVPAHTRVEPLLKTLNKIIACDPGPKEILIHVDGGSPEVLHAVHEKFPQVRVLTSTTYLGPGGSRNRLVDAAACELVANFDDDSFPEHLDYFACVIEDACRFPHAAIISAANHDDAPSPDRYLQVSMASGCGCVFRKSWYVKVLGFVPVPIAYNMEEIDMGLRLYAQNGLIIRDAKLKVIHDKPYAIQVAPELNSAILANTALFPFLRFPVFLWPIGFCQLASRVVYLLRRGWTKGLLRGLGMIPSHIWRNRHWRKPVPARFILPWLALKRFPRLIDEQMASSKNEAATGD